MTDSRANDIITQVSSLTKQFGSTVTVTRTTKVVDPSESVDVFGTPLNPNNPAPFTTQVIIESQKLNTMPTLIGGKPKEELKMIANAGTFLSDDEIQYSGHTYKVNFVQQVPFISSDVVDFVHAEREVDV